MICSLTSAIVEQHQLLTAVQKRSSSCKEVTSGYIQARCSKCWAKQLFMGLLTNKTVKRRHSKGNLHTILGTKLNPPILNNLQCSLCCLSSGNSLQVNYLFFYSSFSHIISTAVLVILPLIFLLAAHQFWQPSSGSSEISLQITLQADCSESKHGQGMWHQTMFLTWIFQQVLTLIGLNISLSFLDWIQHFCDQMP